MKRHATKYALDRLLPSVLLALAVACLASCTSGKPTSDRVVNGWAVLAEKDDYSDVEMTDLLVDYVNITQLHQQLLDAGWQESHIHELREFDREALQGDLDWLAENADQDDIVFLYMAAHGKYLREVVTWDEFFATDWEQIPSHRRLLVIDSCQAADYTGAVSGDPAPYLTIAAVAGDEYGWSGLEEEGLPIIGGVFTHYFAAAFDNPNADTDGDGFVSAQEAALTRVNNAPTCTTSSLPCQSLWKVITKPVSIRTKTQLSPMSL
jgi:hypothetical protein